MTDEMRRNLQIIEKRMASGQPFTYGELCALTPSDEGGRLADRTIQKWRKKGWIAFTREGRNTVWRLTGAGLEAAAVRQIRAGQAGEIDLSQLNPPDTAPTDGRQFLAWAVDDHGASAGKSGEWPHWVIVHYAPDFPGGERHWRWAVPGRISSVTILGWLPLPWSDNYAIWHLKHIKEAEEAKQAEDAR